MSFMAVFDTDGRCKYVLDGSPESVDVSSEAAVVYMDERINPNDVWYDHTASKMLPRTPFRVSIGQNKIERIPAGTVIYVGSELVVMNENSIEFEVDYTQTVVATLLNVRHLDRTVEVPCEAQG